MAVDGSEMELHVLRQHQQAAEAVCAAGTVELGVNGSQSVTVAFTVEDATVEDAEVVLRRKQRQHKHQLTRMYKDGAFDFASVLADTTDDMGCCGDRGDAPCPCYGCATRTTHTWWTNETLAAIRCFGRVPATRA